MTLMKKLTFGLAFSAVAVQATPIFNLFELGVAKGQEQAYNQVGEYNIRTSLTNEKGTLAMYSVKQKADPNMAYMVEIYADQNAYETHRQSPQYRYFLEKSPELLTDHKKMIALEPQFLADKKVEQSADIRTHLVSVTVKPEYQQAFSKIVRNEMAQSVTVENGVLAMYAGTMKNDPHRWYFFEIYQDDHAYQQHRETPHFQAYLSQTSEMISDKKAIEIRPELLKNHGQLFFNVN